MKTEFKPSMLHQLPVVPFWAKAGDDGSAVILTTRVRFARNVVNRNFPNRLDVLGRAEVMDAVHASLLEYETNDEGMFIPLLSLNQVEMALLIERRTISPQIAASDGPRGVFVWKTCDRAIMIGDEDHVHVAEIRPGLSARQIIHDLSAVVERLESRIPFAKDPALGYLTASPANIGAAVRTSLFCHLPALVMTKGMDPLASFVADAGFTVRGFWGEGSDILGNIFQLTDGPALSFNPGSLISRIENLGQEVQEREAMARIDLQSRHPLMLKDRIARALAILQSCRMLSGAEELAIFSAIRLGVDIGFIEGLARETISLLTFELGRAYLEWTGVSEAAGINPQEFRAARVREIFAEARFVG
jgi:protein arginine kinase